VHCEKFQTIAALFRRHQNNAHKLKHCGGKFQNDYSEEWRERTENGGIVQLQYRHRGPKNAEQRLGRVLPLWQIGFNVCLVCPSDHSLAIANATNGAFAFLQSIKVPDF
jgi:hypothetical protein